MKRRAAFSACITAFSCPTNAFCPAPAFQFIHVAGQNRHRFASVSVPLHPSMPYENSATRTTQAMSKPLHSSKLGEDQTSTPSGFHVALDDAMTSYHKSSLLAATLDMPFDLTLDSNEYDVPEVFAGRDGKLTDVISAALLITGNTVGAGMMILPNIAAGPGLTMSTALLSGIFSVNLISGLLIAEVSIKQHESSGGDVPSSFKEFAEVNLQSSTVANMISSISIFVNWCVLSFSLARAGDVASTSLPQMGLDSTASAAGVAALLTALVGTQTNHSLSRFASVAVSVLFASFAGLLLPGLANVHDPIGTLMSPGTSDDMMAALTSAAPIFLTTQIFQNIVPSVTKLLNYDRTRTIIAIILGSLMPLLMYVAFCFAVLGGGLDSSVTSGGPLLTAFAVASLSGSSVAGVMSLSEEFDNMIFKQQDVSVSSKEKRDEEMKETKSSIASVPSVLLAVFPPFVAGAIFAGGEDFTAALNCAGSYGSPLLYGFLPVAMAWTQRKGDERTIQDGYNGDKMTEGNLVPGGAASLGLLGVASAGFMFQEVAADMSSILSSMGLA